MRVRVDRTKCQGYAMCVRAAPLVFDLDDVGKAIVLDMALDSVPEELQASARVAADRCPARAIDVELDASG